MGDITYYSPWGNLALFYRDFGHASGLVRLGRLDVPEVGVKLLRARRPLRLTIGLVEQ